MADLQSWHLPRLLSTAARLAEYAWNDQIAGLGLTPAGMIALEVLAENGPAAQTVLATRARVQPQTMGKTVSKLESSGHVTRERPVGDGRSQLVSISDRGWAALMGARKLQRSLTAGRPDADDLNDLLARVITELSATHGPTTPRVPVPGRPGVQYRRASS